MRSAAFFILLGSASLSAASSDRSAPISCETLLQTALTGGRVLTSESIPAGGFVPPGATNPNASAPFTSLPAFCRVTLRLTPSSDSDIRAEVWLPQSGWNHKLQVSGNGGLGGAMPYGPMASSVRDGYAAAGTDTGHVGGNADFVPGHPEKLVDFGHRAIHETTVTAKTITKAHYDAPPDGSAQ